MTYYFRKVKRVDEKHFSYDLSKQKYIGSVDADSDLLNVLDYLKRTRGVINHYFYCEELDDDDANEYVPVKIEMSLFNNGYESMDYDVTVYCIDINDFED
jgi:hypothetical protein